MRLIFPLIALIAGFAFQCPVAGQSSEPGQGPTVPASAPQETPSTAPEPPAPTERVVSWKLLLPNLISDQKRIWTFPAKLAQGQDLLATGAILGTTAALVAFDPTEATFFRRTSSLNGFNNVFTSNATVAGTVAVPVALYAAGLLRKDSKMKSTALLAGEAIADAEILTTVLKDATGRVRPAAIPVRGNFSDTWFESGGSIVRGSGSFPSGHTIAAFSLATVVARRYGNHKWVPYAAYGMAAAVGFSRLSLSAHFLSDVFMGAALGYSISRFAVLRQ